MSEVNPENLIAGSDQEPSPESKKKKTLALTLIRIGAISLVIGISISIFLVRDQADKLIVLGYPGVFLISFMAYGTVILPAPGLAVIFTLAGVLNPLMVGLVAGAGAAAGEIVGYLAGYSGQSVFEKRKEYERVVTWMEKNAPATIFLLSVIPNPLFDLAGIAAGAFRIPLRIFIFYCWLGETLKMLFFAYLGSLSIGFLERIF